jgi:uncharacterized membrane protein YfcA
MENVSIVLVIIFLSTLVQSTFSFGGALIALPLLAFIIDIKVATPLMTMLSCSIALVIVIKKRQDIQTRNAWRLIVSACLGIPLGIFFLSRVEASILKMVLALTVIVFTLITLTSLKAIQLKNINYAFGFGFVSGIFGGAYNISGPPVVLYGSLMNWSPAFFRATIQSYALFTNIFAILGHALAGNVTRDVLLYYACSLPIVGLTIWLGNLIHQAIPAEKYTIYVKLLLLVLGIRLFCSVL